MKKLILMALLAGEVAVAQTAPFGIATIAGTPYDPSGDNGPATQASISMSGAAFRDGNLYVTDGNRIRKIDAAGRITTIVGLLDPVVHQPVGGYSGDGGAALAAEIHTAASLELDPAGNLYIADVANACVRKVTARIAGGIPQPFDGTEIISTVAGVCLSIGNSGDGQTAISAKINFPRSLAVDPSSGALYIADFANNNVRKVLGGIITTIAGTGAAGFSGDGNPATAAKLNGPAGVAVDPATGDVYIADMVNNRIRKVSGGIITTVAGTGLSSAVGTLVNGGAAITANVRAFKLRFSAGILYVADSGVNTIRRIDLASGIITTLAGIGLGPYTGPLPPVGDGGPALEASFKSLQEPVLDGQGGIFILDSSGKRIRYVAGPAATIMGQTVPAGNVVTIAGPPAATTFAGDGGAAITARLFGPGALVTDQAGNIYLSDGSNNRLREIDPARTIQTIAGTGLPGFLVPSPGLATSANIQPGSLALGSDGLRLTSNGRLLKLAAGQLSIVADQNGTSSPASSNGTLALNAVLGVGAIAYDAAGNLYIGDTTNSRLWKIDATGTVKTVAGGVGAATVIDGVTVTSAPAAATLIAPATLAFDPSGNLYMSDNNQNRIYKMSAQGPGVPLDGTETITLFAGTGGLGYSGDGIPATLATLTLPNGLVFDRSGNLYFNDGNFRIRRIDTHGIIATVGGTGVAGFSGDGGPAALANIRGGALAFDASGNLFMSDGVNQVVRVLDNTPPTLTFGVPVPAPNAYGWNNTSVSIPFSASDTGAGISSTNPPNPLVLSGEGSAVSGVVTATDRAGNSGTFASPVVKIDKTPPTLKPVVSPSPVAVNGVATVTSSAADALSGLASQSCGAVVTNSAGTHTVTCTATDIAGNTGSATVSYVVLPLLTSGTGCNGTYIGTYKGNVTVTSGQSCNLVNGGVTGNITVLGGTLTISNSSVGGNLQVQGGGGFTIASGSVINGNLQAQQIPAGSAASQVCGSTIRGNLEFQSNAAPVLIGATAPVTCAGNRISGNLTIQSNTATASALGNTVGGNLQVQSNSAATIVNGNTLNGNLQDQSNTGATQVFNNTVGGNLQCQGDSSITGGGNKATQKQGQCSAF